MHCVCVRQWESTVGRWCALLFKQQVDTDPCWKKHTSPSIQHMKGWATCGSPTTRPKRVELWNANCCVFSCVQEKSRITVTGRDVAGNSPVRMSSRGIIGSTRACGRFSAKNATGPSPGPTILRCTWNGICETGRARVKQRRTSSTECCLWTKVNKTRASWQPVLSTGSGLGLLKIRLVLVFRLFFWVLSLSSSNMLAILSISPHTGTILECASTYRQNLDVPSAKLNTGNIWISGITETLLKMPLIDLHFITSLKHWSVIWIYFFIALFKAINFRYRVIYVRYTMVLSIARCIQWGTKD